MLITLMKREIKANYKIMIIFLMVITMYSSIIVMMYDPHLGESLNMMRESMPELFAAFGMVDPGLTLLDFIMNYLYGFILIVIPFLFIIVMCYRLIAKYIDHGSFAYLLSSPHSRKEIILSQYITMVLSLCFMMLYTCSLIVILSMILFDKQIDLSAFIVLNIGLFCLHLFILSLCFLFACTFNDLKYSMGLSSGIIIFFVLIQMLSQVSDHISFLKYLTPLTLFDPKGLVAYQLSSLIQLLVLILLAILFFVSTLVLFQKRDLPL